MSDFEWSFIKDYALEKELTVEQVLNKDRKGEIRICALMDETNCPKDFLLHKAFDGFELEPVEEVDVTRNETGYLIDDNASMLEPFLPGEDEPAGNPADFVLYAQKDDRWFFNLDQISLLELVKEGECLTPTVNRTYHDDLKSKGDKRFLALEHDLHQVVIITKDELKRGERTDAKKINNLLKIIGALAEIAKDGTKLNISQPLANKRDNLGCAHVISEHLDHMGIKLGYQTVAERVNESLQYLEDNKPN